MGFTVYLLKVFNCDFLCLSSTLELAWTGWWDEPKEGEFVSIPSSEPLSEYWMPAPWWPNQPNGERFENCIYLTQNGEWRDWPCGWKLCAACQISTSLIFALKGAYD